MGAHRRYLKQIAQKKLEKANKIKEQHTGSRRSGCSSPAHGGRTGVRLVAAWSRESLDLGGAMRAVVGLHEVDRYEF